MRNRKVYNGNSGNVAIKNRTSLRFRFTLAMIFMALIPGILLSLIYFGNINNFYRDKIEIYQVNTLNMMKSHMEDTINKGRTVSEQVLGLAVSSSMFNNYNDMNSYEKLILLRNVNSLLSNIRVSNDSVDNIYMITFDGNYYTSNKEWNKEEFLKNDWTEEDEKRQAGGTVTIPTHTAAYKYLSAGSNPPLVASFVTYLNKYNGNSVIRLIQIDISYQKIKDAMDFMEVTDKDMVFIVDNDGKVIYAPDKQQAGKSAEQISIADKSLDTILQKAGNHDKVNIDSMTVRRCAIKGSNWNIIQINSDQMLRQELAKFRDIWVTIAVICMLAAGVIALSLSLSITKPITSIIRNMKKVSRGDFNIKVDTVADKDLAELVDSFNIMISEVDKLMKENIHKERERMTMEHIALNSQINSHFLYNTLNAVKWMAVRIGAEDIAKMVVSLVNMLEYSCRQVDTLVPIPQEIQFIKDYVYIQEVRYNNSVHIDYFMDKELDDFMILKILLQPIVENVILHGFGDGSRDNRITIRGQLQEDFIRIQIRDNGKGFNFMGFDKLTGIGLHNIQDRIRLNYGDRYKLKLESEIGEGTCVTVTIPIIKRQEVSDAENIDNR